MAIAWNSLYETGVNVIDREHKGLVKMLNELTEAMKNGKGEKVLTEILTSLAKYTVSHFETEEKLMSMYNYPETTAHKTEHQNLKKEVQVLMQQLTEGKVVLTISLLTYLSDWLKNHIQGTDKKFGKFLLQQGYQD